MRILALLLKPILLLFVCVTFALTVHAQKRIDVVHLTNGNVLKGTIVRQVPGKFLELKTLDKNFWKFDMEDIAEISYEYKRQIFKKDSIKIKDGGIFLDTRLGVLIGSKGNKHEAPFSLLTSVNYLFKNGFSFGVGVGFEAFEETQVPLVADFRYHHKINGLNTFLFCQSGYSFAVDKRVDNTFLYDIEEEMDHKGGWLINPGIGMVINGRSNLKYSLGIGYRYQKNKLEWYNNYTMDDETLSEEFNRLSIHLGIIF
ncbi:hypothetical protein [Marinifilum sp.]|uniref:hypothetical protein n=1 Tax=Marinifilum sp. TaxID=2033137 RepID=UPI003BAB7FCE